MHGNSYWPYKWIPLRVQPHFDSSQEPLIIQVFNIDQVSWCTYNGPRGLIFCMVPPIGHINWFPWGCNPILTPVRNHDHPSIQYWSGVLTYLQWSKRSNFLHGDSYWQYKLMPLSVHPYFDCSQEPLIIKVFNLDQVSWHTYNGPRALIIGMVTHIGTRNWFPWGSIPNLTPGRNHWSSNYSMMISCLDIPIMVVEVNLFKVYNLEEFYLK